MRQTPIHGQLSTGLIDRSKQTIRWLMSLGLIVVGVVQASTARAQNVTLAQPNDQRQLDGCASCASFTTGYSTPAFGFNGGSVSTLLRYSSELARPTGYVELNVKYAGPNRPTRIRIQLKASNNALITLTSDSTQAYVRGDTTNLRIAAQYTAAGHTTGVEIVTAIVTAFYGDSAAPSSSVTDSITNVRVLVQNEENSPYGRGWTVAGDARIHPQANGSLLLTDGTGGLAYYALVSCSGTPSICTYTSPTGDYSTMVKTDTVWTRTGRAGDVATWSSSGFLRKVTDRWGNARLFARTSCDSLTCLASIKDSTTVGSTAVTKTTTFAYNGGTGKLASITLPDARQSTFTVGSGYGGLLTAITDPDGRPALKARYTYGALDSLAGRDTTTTNIVYDAYNQVSMLIGPSVVIDSGTTVRDTTRITSQRRLLLEGQTNMGSLATVNADLRDSTFLRVTNALGATSTTWADTSGAPVRVRTRSGSGIVTERAFTYDASYRLTSSNDGNFETQYTWDGPRLATSVKLQPNLGFDDSTAYTYTDYDQLATVRTNGTLRAEYFFSGSKLAPDSVRADSSVVTKFTYDAAGRGLTVTDRGNNRVVTTAYETSHANPSSVVRTATSVTSATTSYSYDGSGRVVSVTDPASRVFATKFDSLNRVVRTIGPLADTVRYITRDSTRTDTLFDAKGQRYVTVRDARGLVTRQEDPRGKSDYFWYDRLGRVVKTQNRRGDSLRVEYDGFDRITRRRAWTAGGQLDSARFTYDTLYGHWVEGRNAESVDKVTRYPEGPPQSTWTTRGNRSFYIGYGYIDSTWTWAQFIQGDSSGTTLWKDTSVTKRTVYHRTQAITDYAGKDATISTDVYGRPNSTTLPTNTSPNQVKETTTYSWDDRPLTVAYSGSNIGSTQNRTYSNYDSLGRIGRVARAATNSPTRDHTYDTGGRLTKYRDAVDSLILVGYDSVWNELHYEWDLVPYYETWHVPVDSGIYTYDKLANRTDHSASLDSANRLLSFDGWTITYDDAGYMTKRKKGADSLVYSWNALGQLTQVTAPGYTTKYGYDAFGNRIRKVVNNDTTRYVVENGQVIVELNNSWQVAAKYSYYPGVDRPSSMVRAGKRYYFLQDAQGNVVAVLDSVGTIKNTYTYTPYGEAISTTEAVSNPFRYKGRDWDSEARLYFMRARYYDPLLGRFISDDPIGLSGGLNPTSFVGGEPVNRADPSGLLCTLWHSYYVATGEEIDRWMVCDGMGGGGGGGGGGSPTQQPTQPPACPFTMTAAEKRAARNAYSRTLRAGTEQGNLMFPASSTFVAIVPTRSDSVSMDYNDPPGGSPNRQFHGHLRFLNPQLRPWRPDTIYGHLSDADSLDANTPPTRILFAVSVDSISRILPGGPKVTCATNSIRTTP